MRNAPRPLLRALVSPLWATARVALLIAPVAAAAAELELETVTVYARRVTPLAEVAATVTVVDEERIESTLTRDIRELVRYEPGLSVRSDPFRFGLDTISIRGLGGNRVAVEIDGIPAAGGFALGSYSDSGRAFVDPMFLRRVEFLRGPASSLYGSDAIGGIVAMSTVAPRDLLPGPEDAFAMQTEAGIASDDDGWHAGAVAAGRAGPAEWLLGYVRREGHELVTAADVEPCHAGRRARRVGQFGGRRDRGGISGRCFGDERGDLRFELWIFGERRDVDSVVRSRTGPLHTEVFGEVQLEHPVDQFGRQHPGLVLVAADRVGQLAHHARQVGAQLAVTL